jgi:HAD superfamily hydrolase (TIGR01549 family)
MPINAVVFDLFDTLVDLMTENVPFSDFGGRRLPSFIGDLHAAVSERADVDVGAFIDAFGHVDREHRQSRYAKGLEVPTGERFDALLAHLGLADAELSQTLTELHMRGVRAQVRDVAHHPSVLADLAEMSSLAVCSNFSHTSTAHAVLEHADLTPHFAAIVISEEVGIRKPRCEIFEVTLAALGCEPAETLHVGDSLSADVAGAHALGIRTAWVTRRVEDPKKALAEFDGPRPDCQIADLAELIDMVAGANAAR